MNEYERRKELKELANHIEDIDIYDYIMDTYDNENWHSVIEYFKRLSYKRNLKITDLSLKLAKRFKKELNIEVFPVIERTYAKFNLKSGGAFIWMMYQSNMLSIGGCDRASEYVKTNTELSFDTSWRDMEIYVDKITR